MLKKLVIGQSLTSFPGGTVNVLIEDYNKRQSAAEATPPGSKVATQPPPSVIALLVWEGSETPTVGDNIILPPGSAVILGAPVVEPADDATVPFMGLRLYCDAATEATKDDPFAILQSPFLVPASGTKAVAYGYIQNACWAQVVVNSSDDETAELVDGQTLLSSTTDGRVPIIWKPTGTGTKWCVVALASSSPGGSSIQFARVTTEVTAATGPEEADWGAGQVELQNESTGTVAGGDIDVENMLIGIVFPVDAQVQVDTSYDPPRVLNGTCEAVDWGD